MRPHTLPRPVLSALLLASVAACDGAETPDTAATAEAATEETPRVWFEMPRDGDVIEGSTLHIELGHAGIEIVPAGVPGQGKGHHHLFVNADVTPLDQIIPANDSRIIHLGQGQGDHAVEGLEPGTYRLIAVLADGVHVPVDPPLMDTIQITVVAESSGS